MSLLAIIQARMNSRRLPGKSMLPLAGIPLIEHVVRRVQATTMPMDVIVATSESTSDDPLAAHVESLGVRVYRGSEEDVLARFYWAAENFPEAEAIVRVTADDPFLDPELIDAVTGLFLAEWASPRIPSREPPDLMGIGMGPSWPQGLNVEVFTRAALTDAFKLASAPEDREHVTKWMAEHCQCWFARNHFNIGGQHLKWDIDDPHDYAFALRVYNDLYPTNPLFGFRAMIAAGYGG